MSYTRGALFPNSGLANPWLVMPDAATNTLVPAASPGGNVWGLTASDAIYIPFQLPCDAQMLSLSAYCTAGTTAGRNLDLGIYDATTLARIGSMGDTLAVANANTWTPATPLPLSGGVQYWAAMACNNVALTWLSYQLFPTVIQQRMLGFAKQATAEPLPDPAVPVVVTVLFVPLLVMKFANIAQ